MNETRNKIINLIQDYMDKTLSEGCIFNIDNWPMYQKIYDWEISKEWWNIYYQKWFGLYIVWEIIWHYDITAVLKFINKLHKIAINFNWEFIQLLDYNNYVLWLIPNKPLNLYSEQEEEDLLNLLTNLK